MTLLETISGWFTRPAKPATKQDLEQIERTLVNINEAVEQLKTAAAKQDEALSEIGTKIVELQTTIANLQDQLATAAISPEAQAAVEAVVAKANQLADIVP